MARHSKFRACPLCEAICGLELQYEGDALVAIRGDDADPFSRGHICPKGNAILDLETDPDRLRKPMRRTGDDWREIGWEEAFTLVGERLAAIQREHGAASVGAYLGNPNVHHFGHIAYLPFLLKLIRTPNVFSASSVDQWPHQLVNAQMYGHQFLLPIPDIDNTDYFLMLGANPIASNGSLMTVPDVKERIKALTARGKLVVLDPRRTETAELASQHHFIKPASDVYFLIAFLQALIKTGAPRVERYAGKLSGFEFALDAIKNFDVSAVETRTGISCETIECMADDFYNAESAVAYGRMGVSVQAHGTLCQWLLQLINIYTGNLDKVGGALVNEAALPITGPGTSPGARGRWHSRVRGLPEFAGELPVSVLCEEISTPGEGRIRALFTSAGNPVLSTPDGKALDAALGSLDFMACMDVYINESTRHADVILPPASFLSQHHYDSVFNAFAVRRVARLNQPVRERAADERADWEIINGIGAAFAKASGKPWQALPAPKTLIAMGLAGGTSGLSMADLQAAEHGLDLGPLRPSLLPRLQTASSSIEAAPELFMQALAELATQTPQADGDSLLLIGRRDIRSNNSWMHNAPRLVKGKPRHQLLMHANDLRQRGLVDGKKVRLRSESGEILVEVNASDELMPGVACLPHGFGHQRDGVRMRRAEQVAGASYNDLTASDELDGPSGNAALNGVRVWVEAL
ncbi:MAG: molybdopterin-dependent oxidoreductase [Arenimonas sp.]|nr:molybdopterin-dependent oxidoreductase [Arenimonas sp.]